MQPMHSSETTLASTRLTNCRTKSHARRKFWEAAVTTKDDAARLHVHALFEHEESWRDLAPKQRHERRQLAPRPMLDDFFTSAERAFERARQTFACALDVAAGSPFRPSSRPVQGARPSRAALFPPKRGPIEEAWFTSARKVRSMSDRLADPRRGGESAASRCTQVCQPHPGASDCRMAWRGVESERRHASVAERRIAQRRDRRYLCLSTRGPPMYKTKNDLPENTRSKAIELLNARLADAIDLQTQTKHAHWNVKGPDFISLHELFDKINEDVEEYIDLIAERAVQLGGRAEGTARIVAARSTLPEYGAKGGNGREHVEALSTALAAFGKVARHAIGELDELDDADSVDILTEVSRGVDKWLWFVEAHLQADR